MAACDQVSKYIQRVTGSGSGGAIPISFPTSLVSTPETTNAQVSCGAGAATTVLAANSARKFAMIVNNSGSALRLRLGAAAVVTSLEFPSGTVYILEPSTVGGINQQLVSIWNPTAGALNVTVQEF